MIGMPGAVGVAPGLSIAASLGGRAAEVALEDLELDGEGLEFGAGQAGEAWECGGVSAEGVIAEHRRRTSAR